MEATTPSEGLSPPLPRCFGSDHPPPQGSHPHPSQGERPHGRGANPHQCAGPQAQNHRWPTHVSPDSEGAIGVGVPMALWGWVIWGVAHGGFIGFYFQFSGGWGTIREIDD